MQEYEYVIKETQAENPQKSNKQTFVINREIESPKEIRIPFTTKKEEKRGKAMAKKDFSKINTEKAETGVTTGEVYSQIERGKSQYKQQGTASKEEQKERAAQLKTQGRKGCKAVRINMAITPENHQFIKVMSQITGKSMTEFTNFVVAQYREEHPEVYNKAKDIIDSIDIKPQE